MLEKHTKFLWEPEGENHFRDSRRRKGETYEGLDWIRVSQATTPTKTVKVFIKTN